MAARVSAKGVTKFDFAKSDPTKQTSSNKEAIAIERVAGAGMAAPPPARQYPAGQGGKKAKGATRTKGGAI